jgi:hypothetical protein
MATKEVAFLLSSLSDCKVDWKTLFWHCMKICGYPWALVQCLEPGIFEIKNSKKGKRREKRRK